MSKIEAPRIHVLETPDAACPLCELPARECSHYACTETLYGTRYLVFIDTTDSE